MAIERGEPENPTSPPAESRTPRGSENDPVLSAFADLVGDLTLDLSRGTLGPALQSMHKDWRDEAAHFRRETAEWVSRVTATRQHMEEVVERQHELAQEVYKTHAKLLQEMAAFQKERRDALEWQEKVSAGLARLGDLHHQLSVESTRIAGVVRDIIGELARYQTDLEKRYDLFESGVKDALLDNTRASQEQLEAAARATEQAMEALSNTNEETRTVLARDITVARRELQEVATRIGRDVAENRGTLQQRLEQHLGRLEEETRSGSNRVLGLLAFGEVMILAALGYLITRLL